MPPSSRMYSRVGFLVRRARETLRYEGGGAFLVRLTAKWARRFARVGLVRLYRKDLRTPLPEMPGRTDITVAQATETDLDRLVELVAEYEHPLGDPGREARRRINARLVERFRRGWRCFAAMGGGSIVHYNWIAVDWADAFEPDLGRFIVLAPGEAFCLDAYTAEGWRGKGVHPVVNRAMLAFLREQGYRTAYTNVAEQNRSAWRALEQLGWERSGLMFYVRRNGARRTRVWPLAGTLEPFVAERVDGAR